MTATAPGRASCIAALAATERALANLAERADEAPVPAVARYTLHEAMLHDRWAREATAYLAQLPRRAVSRCPFTAAEVAITIDDGGLDGPWWRHDMPLRADDATPSTLVGIMGAMRLVLPVERAAFLAIPGPEAPFLLPRLLDEPSVIAVVSTVPVGAHTGYAIAYFAPAPVPLDPPAAWGASTAARADGGWSEADDDDETYDYDLAPWIASGRLRWIAPGDAALTVREGAEGCPYLGIEGARQVQCVQDGEVWS